MILEGLSALAYSECDGYKDEDKALIVSSIINRKNAGEAIGNIVRNAERFKQGLAIISGEKKAGYSEEVEIKKIIQLVSGMLKGTIPTQEVSYYMNPDEIKKLKKTDAYKKLKEVKSFQNKEGIDYKAFSLI